MVYPWPYLLFIFAHRSSRTDRFLLGEKCIRPLSSSAQESALAGTFPTQQCGTSSSTIDKRSRLAAHSSSAIDGKNSPAPRLRRAQLVNEIVPAPDGSPFHNTNSMNVRIFILNLFLFQRSFLLVVLRVELQKGVVRQSRCDGAEADIMPAKKRSLSSFHYLQSEKKGCWDWEMLRAPHTQK